MNGVIGTAASTLLSRLPTASTSDFHSIDNVTEKMLSELGTATKDNIKCYRWDYLNNASIAISAHIKGYDVKYWVPGDGDEELTIRSEGKIWHFQGESLEKDVRYFSYEHDKWHYTLNLEYATIVPTRIRDLLDINVHLQDCKGKDLTHLVDSLLAKVLSVKKFEVKDWIFSTRVSFKKGDFKIEYTFANILKNVNFTALDGKSRLDFYGKYNEKREIDTIDLEVNSRELSANSSYFSLDSGKLEIFPRKVYTENSAMYIINQAKKIEKYLSFNINKTKNT